MVDLDHFLNERRFGIAAWIGREQSGCVRQEDEELRPDQMRHQRGQAVVVAESDLLVGHGVVLVHHGHHAQIDQVAQGPPGMQVLRPVDEVERGQQDLAGEEAVGVESFLPEAHETVLADGGHGLEHGRVRLAAARPGPARPSRRRWHPR